ncbi:PD40 domain-containing protein, partial [Candidatus Uhrbacteria bacterium]|nr:PD40 domain-containing protein [Candidatus Uhrbacteria bacterium]
GSNIVYNFDTEKQVTLPSHWEDFDFSPVADELAAKSIALDPQNRWLVVTSDDGSKTQSIQALGENEDKVQVNWSPNDQVVAFADTSNAIQGGVDRNVIYPVGKNKENFKGLVVEGLEFESLWSPNGKQLLYSVTGSYSNNKPLLWIVDATSSTMGDNRQSLGLNTWVDKCTWTSASVVYCAVPLELPNNAGLQRSLYANEPDALFKLDLSAGTSTLIAIPEEATAMNNLQISDDGSSLYFTNRSGQLELMRLK